MKIQKSTALLLVLAVLCNAKKKIHAGKGRNRPGTTERSKKMDIVLPNEGVSGQPALAGIPGMGNDNSNSSGLILTGNNSVEHAASIGAYAGAKAGAYSGAKSGSTSGAKAGAQAGAEAGQDAGTKAGEEAGKKIARVIALEALQKIMMAQMQNGHVFNIFRGNTPDTGSQTGATTGPGGGGTGTGTGEQAGAGSSAGGGASAGGGEEAGAAGGMASVAGVSLAGGGAAAAAGGGVGAAGGATVTGGATGGGGAAGGGAVAGGQAGGTDPGAASVTGISNAAIAAANAAAATAVSTSGAATKIIHGALYLLYSINKPAVQDYNNNMCLYGIDGQIQLGKYCQYFIAHVPALNRDPNTVSFEPFCNRGSYVTQKNYKFSMKPWQKGVPYASSASFYVFRRKNLQETFSFSLVEDDWFLTIGPPAGSHSWHVIAAFDNSTEAFSQDSSFIVKPYENGKEQNMNCKPPKDTPVPQPGTSPVRSQPGLPGSVSPNGEKCVALLFENEAGSAIQVMSNVNQKTWILSGKELKVKLSFKNAQLHKSVEFHGKTLDPSKKMNVLLDGEKTVSAIPKADCSVYTPVVVTTLPAPEANQPPAQGSQTAPTSSDAGGVHYHYHYHGVPGGQCPASCQTSCPTQACPPACCKDHISVARSEISDERSTIIKQSCNCFMECNGKDANGDEHCKENCTCVPDNKGNKTKGNQKISHPKPNFALAQFSEERMKRLKDVLAGWMKIPTNDESGKNHLNDMRAQFVEKMLKNYEHLRKKAKELRILQDQQEDLKRQQESLEKTIKSQRNRLKKAKKLTDSENDDVSDFDMNHESPNSMRVTRYLAKIKNQLTTLQKQQAWLQKEQDLLFYKLGQGMVPPQGYTNGEVGSETGFNELKSLIASQELQNQMSYNSAAGSIKSEDSEYPSQMYHTKEESEDNYLSDDNGDEDQEYAVLEKKTLHYGSGKELSRLASKTNGTKKHPK